MLQTILKQLSLTVKMKPNTLTLKPVSHAMMMNTLMLNIKYAINVLMVS